MNKAELRKKYIEKRKSLTDEAYIQLNNALVKTFFEHFTFSQINSIHLFLPILPKREVNTFLFLDYFFDNLPDKVLITSVSDFSTHDLLSCKLDRNTKLKPNTWGIPEPETIELFPDYRIDMILVPLLVYDKHGNRVGYGKGFYDRFFTKCKKDVLKVGLSLFEPENEIDDIFGGDVKLDFCVNPQRVYSFN